MSLKKIFNNNFFQLFLLVFITLSVTVLIHKFLLTPVVVKGSSMEPTLQNNNRLFSFPWKKIERFDIVTLKAPDDPKKNYIKRVIGMPGDTLEYKEDKLLVNGEELNEPYLDDFKKKLSEDTLLTQDFKITEKIPPNKYLVLGDNRTNSKDGRYFGLISDNEIQGVVFMRFWPVNEFKFY